jgi:hypothetical protein
MRLEFSKDDLEAIAEAVARRMMQVQKPKPPEPVDDLRNWIRQKDLLELKLFGKSTLNDYYNKGLIGKTDTGGATLYYIPDIVGLLESMHYRKEAAAEIGEKLRSKNGKLPMAG